ncbi:MAG: hypothetical protein CMH45_00715 [Muricauda sp.]|nr:hypothetical protein [Allomuricauda sp.]
MVLRLPLYNFELAITYYGVACTTLKILHPNIHKFLMHKIFRYKYFGGRMVIIDPILSFAANFIL